MHPFLWFRATLGGANYEKIVWFKRVHTVVSCTWRRVGLEATASSLPARKIPVGEFKTTFSKVALDQLTCISIINQLRDTFQAKILHNRIQS